MPPKKFLNAEDFQRALVRLDHEMSKSDFLGAFAPINVVTIGGFLAVNYFKNREATGDLDYMIEPQWTQDDEIKSPLKVAIKSVAKIEELEPDWMNDGLEIWADPTACKTIFERAYAQNIILFDGQSLRVWAAPFEWALERKIRRVAFAERENKKVDMEDALALFKYFRQVSGGPLDLEYFRTLNMNGFDLVPEINHMEKVAIKYRDRYKEDLFSSPIALAASVVTAAYPTVSTGGTQISPWSEWSWSEEKQYSYRYRTNTGEPNGVEYEYDTTTAAQPGPSQLAEPPQEDFPLQYYYVSGGQYYFNDNGNVVSSTRPNNVWVYNEIGWKETDRQKKWRLASAKRVSFK